MDSKNLKTAALGLAAAGVIVAGGTTLANAATSGSQSGLASYGYGAEGAGPDGTGGTGSRGGHGPRDGTGMPAQLTGDTLAKVTAAVKAKDANAQVQRAWKDTDEDSYDAIVTSNGTTIKYEVSGDFATVTVDSTFGQGHGPGQSGQPTQSSQSG